MSLTKPTMGKKAVTNRCSSLTRDLSNMMVVMLWLPRMTASRTESMGFVDDVTAD